MAEAILEFETVTFTYADADSPTISSYSFSVEKGQRVALKGESGSGKTTIFRLILGFVIPDSGTIAYKGEAVGQDTIQELRRDTAWLPQDLNLGSGKTREVVRFPFTFKTNKENTPSPKRLEESFRSLGLEADLMDKRFSNLSTGQRQRAGIALCHLLDKPLILLDEPTSALDSASKKRSADMLFGNEHRTIISTSHDPEWLERCDRVIPLHPDDNRQTETE